MMRKVLTVRWAAALAGCAVLFGILWLGVALGCDDLRGCETKPPAGQHYEKWVTR